MVLHVVMWSIVAACSVANIVLSLISAKSKGESVFNPCTAGWVVALCCSLNCVFLNIVMG